MSEVGIRIKESRESRKLSQAGLAGEAGLAQSTIANIEAGRFNASIVTLARIADALDVTTNWLLGRSQPKELSDEEIVAEFNPAVWATLSDEEKRIRIDMFRRMLKSVKRIY